MLHADDLLMMLQCQVTVAESETHVVECHCARAKA